MSYKSESLSNEFEIERVDVMYDKTKNRFN